MNAPSTPRPLWRSPMGVFMLVAGAVGIYHLLTAHPTHVTQAIPYLVLLACPLMHLFHGRGHHGQHGHGPALNGSPADGAPERR